MAIDRNALYTLSDTAKILNISYETARRHVNAGKLLAYRIGRLWRVPGSVLLQYVGQQE